MTSANREGIVVGTPRRRWLVLALPLAALAAGACDAWLARSPGERLWRKLCARCHGLDAAGNTPQYMGNPWADLTDNAWHLFSGEDSDLESAIRQGVFGEMPANDTLTAEEIRALIAHLRLLRGEAGR